MVHWRHRSCLFTIRRRRTRNPEKKTPSVCARSSNWWDFGGTTPPVYVYDPNESNHRVDTKLIFGTPTRKTLQVGGVRESTHVGVDCQLTSECFLGVTLLGGSTRKRFKNWVFQHSFYFNNKIRRHMSHNTLSPLTLSWFRSTLGRPLELYVISVPLSRGPCLLWL